MFFVIFFGRRSGLWPEKGLGDSVVGEGEGWSGLAVLYSLTASYRSPFPLQEGFKREE